jgi:conjugal transfer pilus assembly protein TraE
MECAVQQGRVSRFLAQLDLMVVLVVGLLLSNLLTGALAWYTTLHQKVEVTPFFGTAGYQKSDASVDSHYLSMMTENFMYARLNLTPETVRANHKRLLSFAGVKYYPKLLDMLNKEARVISNKKTSSYFEIKDMQLDETNLSCTVTGKLKQAVKSHAVHEENATYYLQYQYHLGRLALIAFTRLEQPKKEGIKPSRGKKLLKG